MRLSTREHVDFGTLMSTKRTCLTLPLPLQFLAAWLGVWLGRVLQEQVDYLRAENQLLRKKLGPKRVRLTDAERRRLATLGKALGRKGLATVATIASPETILRWYRELVAKKYDGSQQRGQGRPKTAAEIAALVIRMAKENERWGYTRIMGALKNLGHEIGRNTIKRILLENGIDPAPERGRRMSWAKFIKAHLGAIVGMDLFTVEVGDLAWAGSVSRTIRHRHREQEGGNLRDGHESWRHLDGADGAQPGGCGRRLSSGQAVFTDRSGYSVHECIPPNPGAGWGEGGEVAGKESESERFRRAICASIKSECLDRLVPLGEAHLRRAILEYTNHYHEERNHQGLDNDLISPAKTTNGVGKVSRRGRLGGLLSFYYREAA